MANNVRNGKFKSYKNIKESKVTLVEVYLDGLIRLFCLKIKYMVAYLITFVNISRFQSMSL